MSDIYETLFLGKEAYEVTKFSQKNVRTVIQPIGSSGPDPLDQYGKIGWKASIQAAIVHPLKMPDEYFWEMVEAINKWRDFFDSV